MNKDKPSTPAHNKPWYRQFWPWFIIALPATVVVASFVTLWIAVSNPDTLVVSDDQYQEIRSELKAAPADQANKKNQTGTEAGVN